MPVTRISVSGTTAKCDAREKMAQKSETTSRNAQAATKNRW